MNKNYKRLLWKSFFIMITILIFPVGLLAPFTILSGFMTVKNLITLLTRPLTYLYMLSFIILTYAINKKRIRTLGKTIKY